MPKIAVITFVLLMAGCSQKADQEKPSKANLSTEDTISTAFAGTSSQTPQKLRPCIEAMLNTKIKIKEWEAGLSAKCEALTYEEEKTAADAATELSGKVDIAGITMPRLKFWNTASEAIGVFDKGDLPYLVQDLSEDEEWLAIQGNYQAQRNYAFGLSEKNPIGSCAWRIAIIQQGHKRVDTTDTGNLKVYCGKLDPIELAAAEQQAKQLLKSISDNSPRRAQ